MKVVPVKLFVPHIAPMLEKCPDFVIEREVVKTVASACRESGCITTTVEFKSEKGKEDYEFLMPEGLDADVVRFVYCDGLQLKPLTYNGLTGRLPVDWREGEGKPVAYSFRQHGEMTLFPTPDAEYTVRVDVTATVRTDTAVVPEFFFSSHLDLVAYGVLSRVHRIVGQPYSSMELAEGYEAKYNAELARLKGEAFRDFTRTAGRVRFNRII